MASPASAQEVYRDNVVIVLDASGSMAKPMRATGTPKMDAAKTALKEVLRQVPETTHIGVLVFSARNIQDDWIYPLGPRDDAALLAAIDAPMPRHGTPLGQYMKTGADRLLQERAKQYGYGTYRLLVVTDGEASDTQLVNKYTPEIMARGITVDVIGVDMRGKHTLATQVHSYRSADDPDSLKQAVQDVFAEISSDSNADADEDAFDLIASIPFEVAEGMLVALATSGNNPIGESPKAQRRESKPAQQRQTQQRAAQTGSPPQQEDSGGFKMWQIAIVAIVVLMAIRGGSRRNRRRRR
jgi:hypothetical protein